VCIKQIHDCGIICENKETHILEDRHIVDSGLDDLVIMEVDGAWSTVGTHNQEALDLDKVSALAESPPGIPFLSPDNRSFVATNKGGKTRFRTYNQGQ
jgi:hypothetical protein